ncbi:MAG: glucose-6-phosphate isomerase [bacterium]
MTQNPHNSASRIWQKDSTLWLDGEANREVITSRLGWLDVFGWVGECMIDINEWVLNTVASQRFNRTVVLGMGGSSLAPEVFSNLFSCASGYPRLEVLDSTSPDVVKRVLDGGVGNTLFIVASKSGTTLETMDLYRFFRNQVELINSSPADQFVAITDSGSWLDQHAAQAGFEKVFVNPSDIGGRYSALSLFGLVPAALHGVDVISIVERARQFSATTRKDDPESNTALALGIDLAKRALNGQNKMVLSLPPALESLGAWIEQLVAESTGKQGLGILPVCSTLNAREYRGNDAFNITITECESNDPAELDFQPDRKWSLLDRLDIGAEFFKWEFATAVAASYLGINPFDEPNVSEAKQSTDRFINKGDKLKKQLLTESQYFTIEGIGESAPINESLNSISSLLKLDDGGYVGILAYLPVELQTVVALEELRERFIDRLNVACTIGFGPRYLHSTGQLHKGGAAVGAFVQLTCDTDTDFDIPGRNYSFGDLFAAQADGDIAVLDAKGLPVMRVHLKGDRLAAIQALGDAFDLPLGSTW